MFILHDIWGWEVERRGVGNGRLRHRCPQLPWRACVRDFGPLRAASHETRPLADLRAQGRRHCFEQRRVHSHYVVGLRADVDDMPLGEKIVPVVQLGILLSSPLVASCVMFGRERDQAGVIIEPTLEHRLDPNDSDALTNFRNAIWCALSQQLMFEAHRVL